MQVYKSAIFHKTRFTKHCEITNLHQMNKNRSSSVANAYLQRCATAGAACGTMPPLFYECGRMGIQFAELKHLQEKWNKKIQAVSMNDVHEEHQAAIGQSTHWHYTGNAVRAHSLHAYRLESKVGGAKVVVYQDATDNSWCGFGGSPGFEEFSHSCNALEDLIIAMDAYINNHLLPKRLKELEAANKATQFTSINITTTLGSAAAVGMLGVAIGYPYIDECAAGLTKDRTTFFTRRQILRTICVGTGALGFSSLVGSLAHTSAQRKMRKVHDLEQCNVEPHPTKELKPEEAKALVSSEYWVFGGSNTNAHGNTSHRLKSVFNEFTATVTEDQNGLWLLEGDFEKHGRYNHSYQRLQAAIDTLDSVGRSMEGKFHHGNFAVQKAGAESARMTTLPALAAGSAVTAMTFAFTDVRTEL